MTKFNEKNRKLLANVHAIKQSELSSFFDTRKFINSTLAHQIAVGAAHHYKFHSDSTYIQQILSLFEFGSIDYLKAVRWFEYRTNTSLSIVDRKIKKNPENTINDENYQLFGEFIKSYKGSLPTIKGKGTNKIDPKSKTLSKKKMNVIRESRDSLDLIDGASSMYIGGQRVYGGYGTGKRK